MPPALEIQHLSYAYHDGRKALNDLNLRINAGEKVALVGPNGAGKSTLMLHLNGILHAPIHKNQSIKVCGIEVTNADKKTLAQVRGVLGLVFQQPDDQLFSPTVFDDVAFGPIYMGMSKPDVEQRVRGALAAVGMGEFVTRMPFHLSVGEKKRIALACVLAMQPQVLVLDEPSAGLDPRARRGLINLLRGLPQTMLCSTHDLLLVRDLFPRMVIMDGGCVVADGNTSDLLQDDALLQAHGLERV